VAPTLGKSFGGAVVENYEQIAASVGCHRTVVPVLAVASQICLADQGVLDCVDFHHPRARVGGPGGVHAGVVGRHVEHAVEQECRGDPIIPVSIATSDPLWLAFGGVNSGVTRNVFVAVNAACGGVPARWTI
jgi:hypothetical protein